jgi:phytoene desaturase
MEYGEGIWYPQGGLVQLAQVVADLAVDRGATLRLNAPVCRIEGKRAILETGEEVAADAIIVNADLPYATQTLMGEPPKKRTYSCSGLVMAMDYEGSLPELLHHNVFFGQDFRGNLEQIFSRHELPGDPAFYACVSARSDPDLAPAGHENLFVLVPVPNLEHPWTATDEQTIREAVYARLTREVGFEPERVIGMKSYGPLEYASELNLELGAAFGLSHHFSQSALFRPSNRSRSNPDVYFVGASTVPGNGLPMVLISAELVEQRLEREMGL